MWTDVSWGDLATLEYGRAIRGYQDAVAPYRVFGTNGPIGWHDQFLSAGEGVIVGRKGAYRGVHYSLSPFFVIDTAFYLRLRSNDRVLMKWAYYQLKDTDINRLDSGSAIPSTSREAFYQLPVRLPPLVEQRRIASILSAYDDLIENNTRRIAILEEIARRIYEEWFVRFRFPGHEGVRMVESELGQVPKGWSVQGLYDVAELTYGFPFKSKLFDSSGDGIGVIRIRDIKGDSTNTFTTESADSKYRVGNGDILIGMDGEFHMGRWAGGDAWLNQRVVRLRPHDGIPRSWLFWVTEGPIKHLEATIVGTTVAHLSARDLKEMKLVVPDAGTLKKAASVLEPIYDLELSLKQRSANLRITRDLLLPKLISGELDVSKLPLPETVAA